MNITKLAKIYKLNLFIGSIFLASVLSCSAPQVPIQSETGLVKDYSTISTLQKVVKYGKQGNVNYYKDGTIAISNIPYFMQGNDNTCGQAVITSILNFWGKNLSYQEVVNETNKSNLPTDIQRITDFLRSKGLYAQDYRGATLNFIKDRILKGNPIIVLLDFGSLSVEHYVIVTGYNETREELIVLDSVDGPNRMLPYAKFEKMWMNVSLRRTGFYVTKYDRVAFDVYVGSGT